MQISITALPGLAAVIALIFTYVAVRTTGTQLQIAEQGQITDRYNAAITNLGSTSSVDIRLGGIYALQRIMQDSPRDQSTVVAVLCAFVRGHAKTATAKSLNIPRTARSSVAPRPPADIQAALTVVATRDPTHDGSTPVVDLTGANLTGANLTGANFKDASLNRANLTSANLKGADLTNAHIGAANLTSARLTSANLKGADLTFSNLSAAAVDFSKLNSADLFHANLKGADLGFSDLTDAELGGADLSRAHLGFSDVTGADFSRANLKGADLTGTKGLPAGATPLPTSSTPAPSATRNLRH